MAKKFKFRYVNEIVGGFVLLVFLLLLAGVVVAGKAQHWFEAMYEIGLRFPAEGSLDLQKGAEVMLKGAKVGSVQDILVGDDETITGTIRVRGPFMRFVRTDTVAWVKKKMVVTGDAYIELGPDRDAEGADLPSAGMELPRTGGEIVCKKDTEIVQILMESLEAVRKEAINTLALVNGAIAEYMALGGELNDPEGSLQMMLANLNGLLEDVRKGPGLPAKALNDPAMAEDVGAIVAQGRELMEKINAMAVELQAVVAKLPPMAETVAGEVDNLPVIAGDAQAMMRETTALLDGLQKHWLLRKYMGSDDAVRSGEVLGP